MIAAALAVISTPVGRWLAIGAVGLAIYGAGAARGYTTASSACKASALRSELAAARRALAISQSATADAELRAATLTDQEAEHARQINAYKAQLAKRPGGACALTGDDVRSLRNIR